MLLSCVYLLVISPIILLSFLDSSEGYTAVARVRVKRGMCVYNNTRIPDDSELHLTYPCEMWTCDADGHTLEITGCWTVEAGRGCRIVRHKGPYPRCCPRIRCKNADDYNRPHKNYGIQNNMVE